MIQIRQDVFNGLDTDGEADKICRNSSIRKLTIVQLRMGRRGRMNGQGASITDVCRGVLDCIMYVQYIYLLAT